MNILTVAWMIVTGLAFYFLVIRKDAAKKSVLAKLFSGEITSDSLNANSKPFQKLRNLF